MSQIVDKASDLVAKKTPHVLSALGRIKLFIIGLPILSMLVGVAVQYVLPERHEVIAKFELGSFVLPDDGAVVVDLAEEGPMVSRMRESGKTIREKYDGALLLAVRLEAESPVVTVTATANGLDESKAFLGELIEVELAFQNARFAKFDTVLKERKQLLRKLVLESKDEIGELTQKIDQHTEDELKASEWFAIHNSRSRLREKVGAYERELNDIEFRESLDLYAGKSELTVEPMLVAVSSWYRPLLFGLLGLAVGIFLVFVLCVVTVFRTPREEQPVPADEVA